MWKICEYARNGFQYYSVIKYCLVKAYVKHRNKKEYNQSKILESELTNKEEDNQKKVSIDIILWDKKDLQAINSSRYRWRITYLVSQGLNNTALIKQAH